MIVVIGVGLSYLADVDFALEERVAYGAFFGLVAYVVCAVLTSRLFGFGGGAVVGAVIFGLALSAPGWRQGLPGLSDELTDLRRRFTSPARTPGNHLLFGLFIVPGWIWAVRLLTIAYDHTGGGINSGNLAVYSDWQAHSTYTASFAYANNTGFDLPMATGWNLGYHNGINFFAATLIPSGASLQAALTISSGFCAFFFPLAMYLAGHRMFKSRWVAALGTMLFFMFGGWGWTHFINTSRRQNPADINSPELINFIDNGPAAINDLSTRYTRFYDAGYWLENSVVGHLYPQRPTLIGFPITIIAVMLLWSAYQRRSTQTFLFAGVLVGCMPFFHLFGFGTPLALGAAWAIMAQFEDRTVTREERPRFLAVAVIGALMFAVLTLMTRGLPALVIAGGLTAALATIAQANFRDGFIRGISALEWRSEWLWFLAPAVVLAAPVVFMMLPPESAQGHRDYTFSWAVNAIQGDATDVATGQKLLTNADGSPASVGLIQTIWENVKFWMKNFGFFLPLLFISQTMRDVLPRRMALALVPVWLWFLVPTFTKLHPWAGNNTHYLIFVVLLGAMPVAALLVHVIRRYPIIGMLVPFLVVSMTLSGALDLWHSGDRETENWPLLNASDVIVGDWVRENTDKDAVFVVADDNTHPMSSLTGRRIVAGFNGWIYDLGIPDWGARTQDSQHILKGGENTPTYLQQYEVDYVVLGPREINVKGANQGYWDAEGRLVYDFGGYRIYKVS